MMEPARAVENALQRIALRSVRHAGNVMNGARIGTAGNIIRCRRAKNPKDPQPSLQSGARGSFFLDPLDFARMDDLLRGPRSLRIG